MLAVNVGLLIDFHPHISELICANYLWVMSLVSVCASYRGWLASHFGHASMWHMDKRTDVPNRKFTT